MYLLVFDITDGGSSFDKLALLVFGTTNDVANGCLWHHACLNITDDGSSLSLTSLTKVLCLSLTSLMMVLACL